MPSAGAATPLKVRPPGMGPIPWVSQVISPPPEQQSSPGLGGVVAQVTLHLAGLGFGGLAPSVEPVSSLGGIASASYQPGVLPAGGPPPPGASAPLPMSASTATTGAGAPSGTVSVGGVVSPPGWGAGGASGLPLLGAAPL